MFKGALAWGKLRGVHAGQVQRHRPPTSYPTQEHAFRNASPRAAHTASFLSFLCLLRAQCLSSKRGSGRGTGARRILPTSLPQFPLTPQLFRHFVFAVSPDWHQKPTAGREAAGEPSPVSMVRSSLLLNKPLFSGATRTHSARGARAGGRGQRRANRSPGLRGSLGRLRLPAPDPADRGTSRRAFSGHGTAPAAPRRGGDRRGSSGFGRPRPAPSPAPLRSTRTPAPNFPASRRRAPGQTFGSGTRGSPAEPGGLRPAPRQHAGRCGGARPEAVALVLPWGSSPRGPALPPALCRPCPAAAELPAPAMTACGSGASYSRSSGRGFCCVPTRVFVVLCHCGPSLASGSLGWFGV